MHHSLKKRPKFSHKTRGALLQELAQTTSKSGSGCLVVGSVRSVVVGYFTPYIDIWTLFDPKNAGKVSGEIQSDAEVGEKERA